jgi:hypothetical protein
VVLKNPGAGAVAFGYPVALTAAGGESAGFEAVELSSVGMA